MSWGFSICVVLYYINWEDSTRPLCIYFLFGEDHHACTVECTDLLGLRFMLQSHLQKKTTRPISFMWCMSPWHIQLIIFVRGTRVNFFLLFCLSSFELSTPQLPSHCSIAHISFTLFFLYFPHCSTMTNHYKNPPPHPIPNPLFALPPSHAPTTGHPIHHLSQLRHFQRERGHRGDPKIHHCRTSISVLVSNMHPLHTVLVVDAIPHLFWGLSYWGKGQVFGLWEELNAMRRIEEINVWFQIAWSTPQTRLQSPRLWLMAIVIGILQSWFDLPFMHKIVVKLLVILSG